MNNVIKVIHDTETIILLSPNQFSDLLNALYWARDELESHNPDESLIKAIHTYHEIIDDVITAMDPL